MSESAKYLVAGGLGAAVIAGFFFGPAAWQAHQDRKAARAFTAVVQSASEGIAQTLVAAPLLPVYAPAEWVTIKPKSTEACKQESMGVLDDTYRRCRNGRQELVREVNGRRIVISERRIPSY